MCPALSIITVCYNASGVIKPTLESVAGQTFRDFEYIIIDGASTDGTVIEITRLAYPSLTLISEKDNGIYHAMNKGLNLAKGDFVLFLNAGDSFFNNNVLQRFSDAAKQNPDAGIIYGQTAIVNSQGEIVGPRHLTAPEILDSESFSNGMVVCHQAFFAKRNLTSLFDTSYRFSADFKWCIEILNQSGKNVYLGDEPVVRYLNEGATTKNRVKSLIERFRIMSGAYGTVRTSCNHFKFISRALKRKFK